MATSRKSLVTDERMGQLSAADSRLGLRPGTMYQVMMQESGGTYGTQEPHYPTGIAPNGKKSSAFGPFGILASTGADPGFGVKPLDQMPQGTEDQRWSEQLRFAGDYLQKRGLSAYGEGEKYANQVNARIAGGKGAPVPAAALAQVAAPVPIQEPVLAQAQAAPVPVQEVVQEAPAPVLAQAHPDTPWNAFQQVMPPQLTQNDLNYAAQGQGRANQPNFNPFTAFKGRA